MNTSMPLVSIVIPVYNVEHYVVECLESVFNQSYTNIEILVIEDCSSDNSLSVLESLVRKDNRIVLIRHQVNKGLSEARNTGIGQASGDYILFVDSDDFIAERLVEICVKAVNDMDADLVCFQHKSFVDGQEIVRAISDVDLKSPIEIKKSYFEMPYFSCLKFVKKELLTSNKIKFPSGLYYEDHPVHWELGLFAKKIAFIESEMYFYRLRANSITAKQDIKLLDTFKHYEYVASKLSNHNDLKPVFNRKFSSSVWFVLMNVDDAHLRKALEMATQFLEKPIFNWVVVDMANIKKFFLKLMLSPSNSIGFNTLKVARFLRRLK